MNLVWGLIWMLVAALLAPSSMSQPRRALTPVGSNVRVRTVWAVAAVVPRVIARPNIIEKVGATRFRPASPVRLRVEQIADAFDVPPVAPSQAEAVLPISGDFNRDGALDVATGIPGAVAVSLNQGTGMFDAPSLVAVPGVYGQFSVYSHLTSQDFDEDGWPDIAAATRTDICGASLLRGSATGFSVAARIDIPFDGRDPERAAVYRCSDVLSGDFDADGHADLILVYDEYAYGDGYKGFYLFRGNGDGTFEEPTHTELDNFGPTVAADINADGVLDVIAAQMSCSFSGGCTTHALDVFLGVVCARFKPRVTTRLAFPYDSRFLGLAVADYDGDGKRDVLLQATGGTIVEEGADEAVSVPPQHRILLGEGDGHVHDGPAFEAGASIGGLVSGDVNGDSQADLITSTDGTLILQLGTGDATFGSPNVLQTGIPIGGRPAVVVADFSLDGLPDIASTNAETGSVSLLWTASDP